MNRSGQLKCTNDYLIRDLLDSGLFRVHDDGSIETRIARTGQVFVDPNRWRPAGSFKDTYHAICYKHVKLRASRVIFQALKGELEEDLVIYHKDYNCLNNHPDNLIQGTQAESNKHNIDNPNRDHNPTRYYKLSFETAEKIRWHYSLGLTYPEITELFGVCKSTVSYIINQKSWKRSVHTPNKKYNY
tara:strand:+ start:15169 stop:15729 length:561 start_codon:yes stop_codon:yes gene_type:complete